MMNSYTHNSLRMLPEWAPTEAVMLAWPHISSDWAPWIDGIVSDYVELCCAISRSAFPVILVRDDNHESEVKKILDRKMDRRPLFFQVPYNDTWCRDYGPIGIGAERELRSFLNFNFAGWGSKYQATLDNAVNQALKTSWGVPLKTLNYELEGGSIETDGQGTLLTTVNCLLDSARNPGITKASCEEKLREILGIDRFLWISEGALLGDDTDSHIDNLVRFCNENTLAYITCSRPEDIHYSSLQEMQRQVLSLRQANGDPYRTYALELPLPLYDEGSKRLPASYANFLLINDLVIMPTFGCPQDALAFSQLQLAFPGKEICGVPGNNLIRQYGGPHCATMQLSAGALTKELIKKNVV
jgi:agmatine deiminase